jgi:spore coat protein U-like protein
MQSEARAWRGYGAALAACFLIPWAGTSHAASTTSTTFAVSAQIVATCTINSASTLNFGNSIGVLSANVDQFSTIQVTCTNTTAYNIGLDAGTGSGATVAVRKLTSGGATINYSLYTDAGRNTVWGNTVNTDTVAATGNGSAQSYTVFGRIPAQTTPAPGTYTDTITVTVTY